MRKFKLLLVLLIAASALQVQAALLNKTFYYKVTVSASEGGTVCVTDDSEPSDDLYATTYSNTFSVKVGYNNPFSPPTSGTGSAKLYAKPDEGFVFNRWMLVNTSTGAKSQLSIAETYTYSKATSATSSSTADTWQFEAEFIPVPALVAVDGLYAAPSSTAIYDAARPNNLKKDNNVGDKVRLKTARATAGVGMGSCPTGKSIVFDGWYNKAGELISDQEQFDFTIPEGYSGEVFTANYKFVPLIHGDGYYRIRWTFNEQYWSIVGDYDPTPNSISEGILSSAESRSVQNVINLTDRGDHSNAGAIIKMTAINYNITDYFENNATVATNVKLSAQGTTTDKVLNKYKDAIYIKAGEHPGNYKLLANYSNQTAQIASDEHPSSEIGWLYVRLDHTGEIYSDADAYFDFEPIDEEHVDRFYWGAECDEMMYFDGGYWSTMYTSFPYYLYDEGMEAYYVSELRKDTEGHVAVLQKIEDGKVPANTAVILKCPGTKAIDNRMIPSMEDYPAIENNLLKGEFQLNQSKNNPGHVTADSNMRVLNYNANGILGFYRLADGTELTANRAYLDISAIPAAQRNNIRIATDTSGLDNVSVEDQQLNVEGIYDLYGRKVDTMLPGNIYIVNGKKVYYRD